MLGPILFSLNGILICASLVAQRCKALHRSARGITTDQSSRPMKWRTIGPVPSGSAEDSLAGRDVLVSSCSSDSLWRAGHVHADFCRQLYGVSSDTLVRLATGLSDQCVKKQCGVAGLCFGGRMVLNLRHSRVRRGVTTMGQDCKY